MSFAQTEIIASAFDSAVWEMCASLIRTAYSPNIKERRDHSCAVFDAPGDMIAQAAHIPVHLGAAPQCVKAVVARMVRDARDLAEKGIGFFIQFSTSMFQVPQAWAGLAILVVMSLVLFQAVTAAQRLLFPWSLPKASR